MSSRKNSCFLCVFALLPNSCVYLFQWHNITKNDVGLQCLLWGEFVVVQSLNHIQLCNLMDCGMPGLSFTISWSLLKCMCTELVMPSNCLILCCPLLLLSSNFPSNRVFSSELAFHIRWPKYWSFSISPSNEYSELISFRIDWFGLLIIQGTLKSLLLHHCSKASIFWHSAFFMVQLSHPYMTTGKTITLTIWTYTGKGWLK